ncbi:MAG: RDD family protein [Pseudanabaenaceae cyanobacterium]
MREFEPAYTRYPLAPILHRGAALGIDLLACTLLAQLIEAILFGSITNGLVGYLIFGGLWLFFRVLVVNKSGGQSFGRWLMSLRAIDSEYGKTASLSALFWRELLIVACLLFLINTFSTTLVVFTWLPLAADALFAQVDILKRQTFHDRIAGTIVIFTRKGFELDRKIMGLFGQASEFYQNEIRGYSPPEYERPTRKAPRTRDRRRRPRRSADD